MQVRIQIAEVGSKLSRDWIALSNALSPRCVRAGCRHLRATRRCVHARQAIPGRDRRSQPTQAQPPVSATELVTPSGAPRPTRGEIHARAGMPRNRPPTDRREAA